MKNKIVLLLLFLILSSCTQRQDSNKKNIKSENFQSILDTSDVSGVILIYDSEKKEFYSNDFEEARKGTIPASTYKIPNSIIGLETNFLKDENTIFEWNGNKRAYSIWEKDLSLKEAFQKSCVPCYQYLAAKIGAKKMKEELKKLKFGEMQFTDKTIDNFWLKGKSKITPFQQIDFLKRLHNEQLPISKSTYKTIKKILIIEHNENFVLSGKTGFANVTGTNIAWFVGYLEEREKTFYFATRISPNKKDLPIKQLLSVRKSATIAALKTLTP